MVTDISKANKLLIKIGGSLLYDEYLNFKTEIILNICDMITKLIEKNYIVNLVIGGGRLSRHVVSNLKNVGLNTIDLDHMSIMATRIHADMLSMILSKKYDINNIKNYEELLYKTNEKGENSKINIVGGLFPGQSTNAVAAMAAETFGSDLIINMFSFDYIVKNFNQENSETKRISKLNYVELNEIIDEIEQSPGHYELFDHSALNFVKRSKIPVLFLNGNNIDNIFDALKGGDIGTILVE